MDDKKFIVLRQYGSAAGAAVILHPMVLVRTLIQAGVEPIKPQMRRTYFGTKSLAYPGIFPYMNHIVRVDGWTGLFRGVVPNVSYELLLKGSSEAIEKPIHACVNKCMDLVGQHAPDEFKNIQSVEEYYRWYVKRFIVSSIVGTISCAVFHPLKIIAVRSMVQFDGRETLYNNLFKACKEIYSNEGLCGFCAGLAPLLVAKIGNHFFVNLFSMFFEQLIHLLLPDLEKMSQVYGAVKQIVVGWSVRYYVYPYHLVSTVMMINGSGLNASHRIRAEPFDDWSSCHSFLVQNGLHHNGSYIVFNRPVTLAKESKLMTEN